MKPEDYKNLKVMAGKTIHGLSFRNWPHGSSIAGVRILHDHGYLDISSLPRDIDGWNETGEIYVNRSGKILLNDGYTSLKKINLDNFTIEYIYVYMETEFEHLGNVENSIEFEDSNGRTIAIMSGAAPCTVAIESNFISRQSTPECDLADMTRVNIMKMNIEQDAG